MSKGRIAGVLVFLCLLFLVWIWVQPKINAATVSHITLFFALVSMGLTFYNVTVLGHRHVNTADNMKRLEEKRHIWEVRPIIVPIHREEKELVHRGDVVIEEYYFQIGIRNIGRGVAVIDLLQSTCPDMDENKKEWRQPLFLGQGDEFICAIKPESHQSSFKFDDKSWDLHAKYKDIHENGYFTNYKSSKLEIGPLP